MRICMATRVRRGRPERREGRADLTSLRSCINGANGQQGALGRRLATGHRQDSLAQGLADHPGAVTAYDLPCAYAFTASQGDGWLRGLMPAPPPRPREGEVSGTCF